MSLDFINTFTSIKEGIFGFTFWAAPDYFYNPVTGVLPILFRKEALLTVDESFGSDDAAMLDPVTRIGLMGTGATMFTYFLYHMQFHEDRDVRVFCRAKLFLALFRFAFLTYTLFSDESGVFVKETLAALAVCNLYSAIWLAAALWTTPVDPEMKNVKSTKREVLASLLSITYVVPFALIMIAFTQELGPAGKLSFIKKTGTIDGQMGPSQMFVFRLEGACLANHLFLLVEVLLGFSKTIIKLSLLGLSLFTTVLWTGAMDDSGFLDRKSYAVNFLFHAAIIVTLGKLVHGKTGKEDFATYQSKRDGSKDVPDLIPDIDNSKEKGD